MSTFREVSCSWNTVDLAEADGAHGHHLNHLNHLISLFCSGSNERRRWHRNPYTNWVLTAFLRPLMDNCGNQARVRASAWWLSGMKQDQTHTRLYKPAVGIHMSVVVRTHNFSPEILSWLKPGGLGFIWSCFICRTISQQNNRGQCILTFIFTSPQVHQPPACFVLDIYESVCVCVLPWTAHTAGPPSLDSSGLHSCSVSPWTSHWNTRREKNDRL